MNDLVNLDNDLPRACGPRRYAAKSDQQRGSLPQIIRGSQFGTALKRAYRLLLKSYTKQVQTDRTAAIWPDHRLAQQVYHGDLDSINSLQWAMLQHPEIDVRHMAANMPWEGIEWYLRQHQANPHAKAGDVTAAINRMIIDSHDKSLSEGAAPWLDEGHYRYRRRYGARAGLQEAEGVDQSGTPAGASSGITPQLLHQHAGEILALGGAALGGKIKGTLKHWHREYGKAGAAAMAGAYLGIYAAAAVMGPKVFALFPLPSAQIAGAAKLIKSVLNRRRRGKEPIQQRRRGRPLRYSYYGYHDELTPEQKKFAKAAIRNSFLNETIHSAYPLLKKHVQAARRNNPQQPVWPDHHLARAAYHGDVDALEALGNTLREHENPRLQAMGWEIPWESLSFHIRRHWHRPGANPKMVGWGMNLMIDAHNDKLNNGDTRQLDEDHPDV